MVFKLQTEVQCRFSESRKHNQSLTIIKSKKTFFPQKEKKTVKISHVIRIASKSNLQIQEMSMNYEFWCFEELNTKKVSKTNTHPCMATFQG